MTRQMQLLIFENFEILEARNAGLNVDYFALKDYNVPDFVN